MNVKEFREKTKGMTQEEIIDFYESHVAFQYGAPGTYLTDLHENVELESSIKTEKEIREEINSIKRTIENYRESHKKGKIPFGVLKDQLTESYGNLSALHWVLGENDRYD